MACIETVSISSFVFLHFHVDVQFKYEPTINNGTIDGSAQCTAIANSSATAESFSNQAIAGAYPVAMLHSLPALHILRSERRA
jgi:hypothetical protein